MGKNFQLATNKGCCRIFIISNPTSNLDLQNVDVAQIYTPETHLKMSNML